MGAAPILVSLWQTRKIKRNYWRNSGLANHARLRAQFLTRKAGGALDLSGTCLRRPAAQ